MSMLSKLCVKRYDMARGCETIETARAWELYYACLRGDRYFYNFKYFDLDIVSFLILSFLPTSMNLPPPLGTLPVCPDHGLNVHLSFSFGMFSVNQPPGLHVTYGTPADYRNLPQPLTPSLIYPTSPLNSLSMTHSTVIPELGPAIADYRPASHSPVQMPTLH